MDIPWHSLASEYGAEVVYEIRRQVLARRILELDPTWIARESGTSAARVRSALLRLVDHGTLKYVTTHVCFVCKHDLSAEEVGFRECPYCEQPFDEMDAAPQTRERFLLPGDPRRTISWLVAIHGMNTTGSWQEEFTWRIATKYKYSAPVAIYKYGIVRPGVLLRWRQRQLAHQLGDRLLRLMEHAEEEGFDPRPDIIAHSFGTWLVGHLLTSKNEKYRNISFGRVILTGCILRPDFDWSTLIEDRRVEAVLNHYGTKDFPVRLTHYFIPDSGPSGRTGFVLPGAYNAPAEDWGHGSFFDRESLRALLAGGLWEEFLTRPTSALPDTMPNDCRDSTWTPAWGLLRVAPRYLALLLLTGLLASLLAIVGIGGWTVFSQSLIVAAD